MKKLILITTTLLFACFPAGAADKSKTTADHLQDVSVTIRAEGDFSMEKALASSFVEKTLTATRLISYGQPRMLLTILEKQEKQLSMGRLKLS